MSGDSPRRATKRVLSVVMALAMITSVFAGGVVAQESPPESDIADEVYVTEEGDAVLVYEEDASGNMTGEYGVDVAEGVVYTLLTDDLEEDVSAAFDLWADPDGIEGSTDGSAPRPEEIDDFSMAVSGAYTDEEASFDADLDLTVNASEEPMAMYLDEASTQGSIESSADRFASSGEYALATNLPQQEPPERFDVAVSGTAGDYTLEVRDQRPLAPTELDRWENETVARASLEKQFGVVADDLGGDATVTIHEYDLAEDEYDRPVLDVEYTVEYEDLDAFAPVVAAEIANDEEIDLTQDEAEALLDAVFGVEIDRIDVSHAETDGTIEGEWDVEVRNMSPIAEGMLDLFEASFEASDDDELEELGASDDLRAQIEDLRAQIEAQTESGLVRTTEWNVEVVPDDTETVTLTASISGNAENWGAYVAELEERGVDQPADVTFEGQGETVGDRIEFELAVEVGHDELFDDGLASLIQQLEDDSSVGEEELEFWQALDDAGFRIAGIDFDATGETVTLTAGAKFDDLGAFQTIIEDEFHGLSVSHVYGDATADTERQYLYVDGMVDADPSEADVRETPLVGDETEVHLDASLEEHPRLDVDAANEFLGLESDGGPENETEAGNETEPESEPDDTGDDGMPGFGVGAAVAVLLSVALLRHRD